MYTRDIVILANSRKNRGHCIAGKDLETGKWVRPIPPFSKTDSSAFDDNDFLRLYDNSFGPCILDCVRITFKDSCPCSYQPENEYVHWESRWEKIGGLPKNLLSKFEDIPPFEWIGISNRSDFSVQSWQHNDLFPEIEPNSQSDRIPSDIIEKNPLKSSLVMLRLNQNSHQLRFEEKTYRDGMRSSTRPRLLFRFDGVSYDLSVTDLKYDELITTYGKEKVLEDCYVTIGIGEKYTNTQSNHKLVVGIIPTFVLEDL